MNRIAICTLLLLAASTVQAETWRLYRTTTGGNQLHVATFDNTFDSNGIEGLPYNHRMCIEVRNMYQESKTTRLLGGSYWCERYKAKN